MLHKSSQNWQALLAADPGYEKWMARDEEERMNAILAEEETRRSPYGNPDADCGYPWEGATTCNAH